MRDIYHNISVTDVLDLVTATTTQTSNAIDLQGYNSLTVVFAVGATGDTLSGSVYWTLKVQDSDDNTNWNDVTTAGLYNASATTVINAPTGGNLVVPFGYVGNKRYVRGVITPTGTHSSGTPLAVLALRGHSSQKPVI